MAASNYMTIEDTRSIWKATLGDATRFGKIGVRMAEILNFTVTGDASTNVVNTAITPILEQLSEEALFNLIAAAKIDGTNNPWNFVQANVVSVMSKLLQTNRNIIHLMQEKLYGGMRIVSGRWQSNYASHG